MAYPYDDNDGQGTPNDERTKLPSTSRIRDPRLGKAEVKTRPAQGHNQGSDGDEVDDILKSHGMFCRTCGSL